MRIGDLDLDLAAAQLQSLFGIENIFRRRGRLVTAFERPERLLFSVAHDGNQAEAYQAMKSLSFRKVVSVAANSRDTVTVQDIVQLTGLHPQKVQAKLEMAESLGMLQRADERYHAGGKDFGPTLEWYIAAMCTNELSSIAYWGVQIKDLPGDYDVVVIRENQIGYVECKSGRVSNITDAHLLNFLDREQALAPQFSVFHVDGISMNRVTSLAERLLEACPSQSTFQLSHRMAVIEPIIERYRSFLRLIPLNIFLPESSRQSISEAMREVYEFLTLVTDRPMYMENIVAKARFRS